MGRAPAASEHALFSSVFVGATLRGRPFRNVNFAGLPQNANAVRFVGKRRRRRPKRRFFAGKPSNCAVHRRRPRQLVKCFSTRHSRVLDETSRFRATTWGRPYGGRFEIWITPGGVEPRPCEIRGTRYNVFPLGIVAHRVSVGTWPYCSHFLCGNASPCRPVPPFSHRSFASVGTLYLIRFRNPRHSV